MSSVTTINTKTTIDASKDAYLSTAQDASSEYSEEMSGLYYFMKVFEEFVGQTIQLQSGATNLTEAMEEMTKLLNDAKDKKLKEDNDAIKKLVDEAQGKKGDDFQKIQAKINLAESQYKLDDTSYQSILQAMSPITTACSDLTTTISQNNNTVNQMAMYVIGVLKTLAESLIRLG